MTSSNHPLVHLFIRPGMTLMRALHLRAKIVVLALALGLPLGWLTGQMLLGAHADLASTRLESAACPLVSRLLSTAELAQFHRGLMGRRLAGDRSVDAELAPLRDGLRTNAASVGELIRSLPELGLSAAWQPVERDLLALASGEGPATAAESFAQHTRIVAAVRELVRRGAEASGLLLDPDAVPFHLMHVAVEPILPWTEALAQLRGRGAAQLRKDQLGAAEIGEIVAQTQLLADASATAESMMAMVVRAGEPAPKGFAEALAASRAFADQAVAMFTGAAPHADPARYFDDGTRAIQAVTAFGRATTDRLEQLLRERASRLQWLWFASLVAGAGTLFAVAYLTLVFFLTSHGAVRVLRAAVAQLAGGDFSSRIRLRKTDELGVVGESLDTMTQHLSEMVADVRSNSTMVAQAGLTLASESKLLAERTESQAATLEETAASVQEVSAGVRRGAEAADAASGRATAVRALAEEGGHAIRSAVASMRDIQSSSQRVQEIVGVIEGLSFRTNLLALNAAVEAARAGEQGRGFAVVASEVRTLASRSAESAREISALIQASVAHVDKGAAQIDAASRTFEDIVSGIREVAERVHEIKVSSAEQSGGLDQVSEAVRHIDEITQQNVKMVEAAFHNSSQLSQRADSLAAAVASFKLRQGSADEALALTRRGVALYRQHGPGALPMITDKAQQLCDRDMYVFAFDRQGVYRAFAGNAAKVGTAVKDNPGVDGEKLVRDAFAQAERGGGWVDYDFRNPQTGAVDRKTSYVEGVAPDLIVGCGVYKSRGAPTVAKAAPAIAVAGRAEQRTRQKARASAVAA